MDLLEKPRRATLPTEKHSVLFKEKASARKTCLLGHDSKDSVYARTRPGRYRPNRRADGRYLHVNFCRGTHMFTELIRMCQERGRPPFVHCLWPTFLTVPCPAGTGKNCFLKAIIAVVATTQLPVC
jgi:hypothetical protein